ncbi:MAG: ATP-binding protein [Alphaproteobacteria bacterium]|nr:ATP-binding protein [Alphaproteobacteria bacterium]
MKIAFTGAWSTGKTTMLDAMIDHYGKNPGFGYISEVVRNVHREGFPLGRDATIDSYVKIMNYQLKAERNMADKSMLISDRSLLDMNGYFRGCRIETGENISDHFVEICMRAFQINNNYDLYAFFPIEFPIVPDDEGIRPLDEAYRQRVSDGILSILKEFKLNHIIVSGSREARRAQLIDAISQLEKSRGV